MASIAKRPNGRWRARYRDHNGDEHASHFTKKTDAQRWLDEQTAKLVTGTHLAPRLARVTVDQWCDTWLRGYATRRSSSVRQAEVHVARIRPAFGPMLMTQVRPSAVRAWCADLKAEGLADSYVYALHARLAQVFADAVHDGIVSRSPCSRRTSPPSGKPRPYVATSEQVWALYDAFPEHLRAAVLIGAFIGARDAEACGMRRHDLELRRGIWQPALQYPAEPLKTEISQTAVPFGRTLAVALDEHLVDVTSRTYGRGPDGTDGDWVLCNLWGDQLAPWTLQRAMRAAREQVPGLPDGFRYHDLRHHYASLLIASGLDVKTVQMRLRHASAKTTLDTYSHLWPDRDDSTRAAIDDAMTARADSLRTPAA